MRKIAIIGACIGSFLLIGGCDYNNSKLTADQLFQLKQMEMAQQNQMRRERHELEMARATHPAPVVQSETQYVESEPQVVYRDVPVPVATHQPTPIYPDSYGVHPDSNSSGSSVGSHVATAAVGAAAGYMAGKYTSTPKGKQQVQTMKDKSKSMYQSSKAKAFSGFSKAETKTSSAFRSFKKRK